MKLFIAAFIVLVLLNHQGKAQDSLPEKQLLFRTTVKDKQAQITKGYLYAISDSLVLVTQQKQVLRFYPNTTNMEKAFNIRDIEYVKIHRKGALGRSVLIGTVSGALIGAITGFAGGDDPKGELFATTASEKAVGGAFAGGVLGALTGLIIGFAAHKTFTIHGKKERFEQMRSRMMSKVSL
jgi:hypothetical protein